LAKKTTTSKAKASSKPTGNKWWRYIKRFFIFLFISHILYVLILKWVLPPTTPHILKVAIQCATSPKLTFKHQNIPYSSMGKNIKLAVLAAEDQLFPTHSGFDLNAIQKAIEYNKTNKSGKVRGASTLSQQVAKNVFLWHGRDYVRKGLEAYFTLLIEWIWGKQRILETYLNVAEMGEGIFGVQAAAQHYFKKDANKLNESEAAWIASILPNPVLYQIENPSAKIEKKHEKVLRFMQNLKADANIQALLK
jgi:monofunctional glycosyltransferase